MPILDLPALIAALKLLDPLQLAALLGLPTPPAFVAPPASPALPVP